MAPLTTLVTLLFLSLAAGVPLGDSYKEESVALEFRNALSTGHVGPTLKQVAKELDLRSWVVKESHEMKAADTINLFCPACNIGFGEIIHLVNNGTDPKNIVDKLIILCVDLGISNHIFCESFLWEVQSQLLWVMEHREGLTGKDMCGMMFGGLGCHTKNPDRVWEVTLPDVEKPPVTDPVLPEPGSPVMKILHLADTHYDPDYLPGSNAVCGEKYFCCRAESGPVVHPEDAAGKWGDYRNCDAPKWLLEKLYEHVNNNYEDLDLIIWTGDLTPHIVWNTSREGNLKVIKEAVQMIHDYFPGVPVFPTIGNHESHPVNAFPQPYIDNEFDISWLYDEIAELWETWLPPEVATSIAYSAYYTTLIKPGLRVISTNTNYCYDLNWWLVYDDVDPADELHWLARELQKAEDAGELVYILGHIPPGHEDCTNTWSHQYNRIIYRYESTIVGLFYGHTHKDHFMMFYDPNKPERAYHVGYVAQSQTTYNDLNPGYRVYIADGDYNGSSYRVLDTENWALDLDEANKNDDPSFYLLYSAKEAYGINDLFPESWANLVEEMKQPNSTAFKDFFKFYSKDGRPYREKGCDEKCKASLICRLIVSDTSDKSRCDGL